MKVFKTETPSRKINFVDGNNVFVGYDFTPRFHYNVCMENEADQFTNVFTSVMDLDRSNDSR